jgi:hypothetical protein
VKHRPELLTQVKLGSQHVADHESRHGSPHSWKYFTLIPKHLAPIPADPRFNLPLLHAISIHRRIKRKHMPATQKQIDANRRNSRKSTGPKSPEGKVRASLNGWRHGLTGQVLTMAREDRDAFETFARELRQAYFPVGALETQIAQSLAEDEWRLSRARAIENNVIALGHSSIDGEVETINTQMHAAMTQARVFWRNPEKFALLSLYEQRISRKLQHNEARLRALQTDRKAALQQALTEARILAGLAESKGEIYDPTPDFAHRAQHQNGFGFSTTEILRLLDMHRKLSGLIPSTGRTNTPFRRAA